MLARLLSVIAHAAGIVCRPAVAHALLDVAGLGCIVVAAWVAFGSPVGLALLGASALIVSWRRSR